MSTEPYHKIQTLWKRTPRGVIVPGDYSTADLAYLAGLEWEWTEKVDGTNIRIGYDGTDRLHIGGRTDRAQIPAMLLDALANLLFVDLFREQFPADEDGTPARVTLYGEGYGARIQKGGGNYIADAVSFVLFDVKVGDWWLKREAVAEVGEALGIDVVPVVGRGTLDAACDAVMSGLVSDWGDFEAEGLVCRPRVQLFTRKGQRIITKVKAKDYQRLARLLVENADATP